MTEAQKLEALEARREMFRRRYVRAVLNNDPNLKQIAAEYDAARTMHLDEFFGGLTRAFSK